jgi:putative transposase
LLGARSLPLGYNAVAESFFGTLKMELVFLQKYITRDQAKRSIVDYIEMFYNSNRRHSYLDYISPMEYESQWLLKKAA